jgi:RNA polymerase sigma factor (sigma-70 family)
VTPGNEGSLDAQRFTALYREHHARVGAFATRRVGPDLAQEIVAETFLVAWRRIDAVPAAAMPWLYRVALFEIANLRRRQAKTFRLQHVLAERHATAGDASGTEGDSDLAEAVAEAFDALKPHEQEILRLAAWEQLTNAEGAAVLGCTVPAYRMRLHRARARLADAAGAREDVRSRLPVTADPAPVLSQGPAALGRHPLIGVELAT